MKPDYLKWIAPLLLIILIIMAFASSCYYDSQEFLFPQVGTCDTVGTIPFARVDTIMQNNCVSCHNSSISDGNVNLDGYSNVQKVATTIRNGTPLLQGVIRHMSGFVPMPPAPAAALDECKARTVELWIEQGAQQ
jgi:hypothetical protein